MAAEGWVTMSKRISAWVKGHGKVGQLLGKGTHCRSTLAFLFIDATFRSGDMGCQARKSWKSGLQIDVFVPKIWGRAPKSFGGICKLTPLPTYWLSLVAIPWLVFHLCWQIFKKSAVKYRANGLSFGGHNKHYRTMSTQHSRHCVNKPVSVSCVSEAMQSCAGHWKLTDHRHSASCSALIASSVLRSRTSHSCTAASCWVCSIITTTHNALGSDATIRLTRGPPQGRFCTVSTEKWTTTKC